MVVSGTGWLPPLTHSTTEQGSRLVPVTVSVKAGAPTATEDWESEAIDGAASGVLGVVMVNGRFFEVPIELDTETAAVPENAVSAGKIAAVSWVELTNVVARGEPFQLTTASVVKFVPFTASVRPAPLQYGVEACDVVEAESEVTAGPGPGVLVIVKRTIFEISVVVVALVLEVPDWAEPGTSMATCTVPAAARYVAGTGAVSCAALTNVVVRALPFHKM